MEMAVRRMGITTPVALARGELLAPLGARGVPATVLISRHGRIVGTAQGPRGAGFFLDAAEELLDRP